jgi:hypothetical protein
MEHAVWGVRAQVSAPRMVLDSYLKNHFPIMKASQAT